MTGKTATRIDHAIADSDQVQNAQTKSPPKYLNEIAPSERTKVDILMVVGRAGPLFGEREVMSEEAGLC